MRSKVKNTNGCCGESVNKSGPSSASGMDCCAHPAGSNKGDNDPVCSGSLAASSLPDNKQIKKERLNIDFMYLDLSICTRCQGTESSLDEAIAEVSKVLEVPGTQVNVQKVHVKSEAQAAELGFIVSPTIRVNGQDIQMNYRESHCKSCGTLCDCEDGVSCRKWEYQGQWYVVPPKGLIMEAILKQVYGGARKEQEVSRQTESVPDNLKRFFDSAHQK